MIKIKWSKTYELYILDCLNVIGHSSLDSEDLNGKNKKLDLSKICGRFPKVVLENFNELA